jgi:anti-sigma factor RsiW
LQAYVDCELDAERRAEIDAALRKDAALRTTLHRYEAQKRGVQRLYDNVLSEPVPESLAKLLKIKGPAAKSRHH